MESRGKESRKGSVLEGKTRIETFENRGDDGREACPGQEKDLSIEQ